MKLGASKKTLLKIFIITIIIVWFFGIVGINIINAQEDDLAEITRDSVNPPGEIDKRLEESTKQQRRSSSDFDGTFIPLSGIPGVIDDEAAKDPSKFFNGMFTFGISIAGFLAVLMIAIGGIQYMSTDAISGKTEGKDRITYAIMGLLLVLFSWVLLNQINPNILNLDIFSDISGGSSGGSNAKTTSDGSGEGNVGGSSNNKSFFIKYSDADIYVGADERGFYKVVGEDKDGNEIRFYPALQTGPGDRNNIPSSQLPQNNDGTTDFLSSDINYQIKQLEDLIKTGNISESDKELARQKILELKNQ